MHRSPGQFERALPLPEYPQIYPANRRDLRAATQLLGHRHHPHALLVEAVRHDVHRRDAMAEGPRPRTGDGSRGLRLARLEIAELAATGGRDSMRPHPGCLSQVTASVSRRSVIAGSFGIATLPAAGPFTA